MRAMERLSAARHLRHPERRHAVEPFARADVHGRPPIAPDRDGEGYTVVFTERDRSRGGGYLRAYLVKGVTVAINVMEADGAPSYAGVTTLVVDQGDALSLSQPSAHQARLDLLVALGQFPG